MNKSANKKAIIWLSKIGLSFYIEGLPNILNLPFFGESVKYFDIVDEDKLTKQIEEFILKNKLPTLNAHFIVGPDALIQNEFQTGNETVINQYLDMIPFELIYSKKILKPKSILVTAVNGDFYRIVNNVLEKNYSKILTLLPYPLVGYDKLDNHSASLILKKAETLKSESMIDAGHQEELEFSLPVSNPNEEKSTLPILVPISGILIIVLAAVIFISTRNDVNNKSIDNGPTATPVVIPTPTNFPISPAAVETEFPSKSATNSAL